jgi:sec-independent protein translocase protein TatA
VRKRAGFQKEEKMFGGIGMPELLIILVIVMIVFGANKLPQIGEGLGKGIRNFKKGFKVKDETDEISKGADQTPRVK